MRDAELGLPSRIAIGVLASTPGAVRAKLRAAYDEAWLARLGAAMLRDTLDGLTWIEAERYVVFGAPADVGTSDPWLASLEGQLFAPWQFEPARGASVGEQVEGAFSALFSTGATRVVLVSAQAPSFDVAPLQEALRALAGTPGVVFGPSASGGAYLLALSRTEQHLASAARSSQIGDELRSSCETRGVPLCELPSSRQVRAPVDVEHLFDELRRFPERAPRTAQLLASG